MKNFYAKLLALSLLFAANVAHAQVGIGTTAPAGALDITSANDGLLIPRVALSNTATSTVLTPTASELVYNTATAGNVTPGFYYWSGTAWIRLAVGNNTDWSLTGNAATVAGTNFLGTTDAIDIRFKTAGTDRWNISNANAGQLQSYSLGTAALPTYSFQGDQNTGLFSSSADALDFSTGATSRFRIPAANQVHAMSLGTAALPFYSFSADTDTGILSSGANAIDFSTGGTSRFRIPAANQVHAMALGTATLPFYTFSADPDTGMYSTTTNTLAFGTNAAERMRLLANGQIIVNNTAAPFATDVLSAYSSGAMTRAIAGYSTLGFGRGVYGQATGANGAGVQGGTNVANGFGVWGFNSNVLGTGTNGAGNNQISTYLTLGSGGSFTGFDTGIYGFITTGGEGQGMLLQDDFLAQWNVGYFDAATLSYYKIIGDGTVSTTVKDTNGDKVVMHCTETPENLFEDYGTAQLVNGRITIQIDPIFTKNIMVDDKHPLKVFIQLEGECKGVYVTNKSATSFDVVELQSGQSNTPFSYSIVATRGPETYTSSKGQVRNVRYDQRFERAPKYREHTTMSEKPRETN